MTESVLEEAQRLIHGERAAQYGDASENFGRIADYWSNHLGHHVTTLDVSVMMALVKIARLKNGYHRDSVVDIAGYAALAEKVHTPTPMPLPNRELDFQVVIPPKDPETRYRGNRPRIWNHIADVPPGVEVIDREDDSWRTSGNGDRLYRMADESEWKKEDVATDSDLDEHFGPFTEVIEDYREDRESSSGDSLTEVLDG